MERKIYLVHKDKKAVWVTNKRDALKLAKEKDADVRFMPYSSVMHKPVWDLSTAKICSDPLCIKKKKGTYAKKRTVKKSYKRRK